MPLRFRIFLLLLVLGLSLTLSARADLLDRPDPSPLAPDVDLKEQILSVPVSRNPPVQLEVTLMMPVSGGPFPLAVVNHGSSPDPAHSPRLADNFAAYYFLSRGYAVALPMMRGYANSTGHMGHFGCDAAAEGLASARDISTVIDYVAPITGIDPTRIVVAGKSIGGWHTLALGTLNIPNVRGLVSFAGGAKESDCPTADAALLTGAGQFGAHTKIPSIWFFGENDKTFATATWQGMFRQYNAAGAPSELVDIGTFMDDAHTFTASGAALPRWVPKLDAFLAKIGMPSQLVLPIYLPAPAPTTSNYANINDLDAVPYLNTTQLDIYKSFLSAPLPRAIAIGLTNAQWESGGFDPAATAMRDCWKVSRYCHLYAVDNTVVWPRLESAPPATQFAALADVSAVPYLNPKGRAEYTNFLLTHRPRAFAIAPDGSWGAASGLDPMTDAMIKCSSGHVGCALYAVDADVVWPVKTMMAVAAKR
jgi:dienelactone hydrolase